MICGKFTTKSEQICGIFTTNHYIAPTNERAQKRTGTKKGASSAPIYIFRSHLLLNFKLLKNSWTLVQP